MKFILEILLVLLTTTLLLVAFRLVMPDAEIPIWRTICGWTVVWAAIDLHHFLERKLKQP